MTINPITWYEAERIRAGKIEASIGTGNQIRVSGPADGFRVHLRPMAGIDFAEPMRIRYGGRTQTIVPDGNVEPLLEDFRRRADRKRGTWMTISFP